VELNGREKRIAELEKEVKAHAASGKMMKTELIS